MDDANASFGLHQLQMMCEGKKIRASAIQQQSKE